MKAMRAFATLALGLVASLAGASDFDDYRIPASSWMRYELSLGGQFLRSSSNPTGSYRRDQTGYGQLDGSFALGRDSDPVQWDAALEGSASGAYLRGTLGEFAAFPPTGPPTQTSSTTERTRIRDAREFLRVSAGARWYPGSARIGLELRGSASANDEQVWNRNDEITQNSGPGGVFDLESQQSSVRWTYRESADLTGAAGVGRVRDASPVFLAQLLVERLERDGQLTHAPSPACRRRLAELITLRGDFSIVHELSEKFFWAEVERLLREDGALVEEGLDAFAALHVAEKLAVAGSAFVRRAGWFIGPALSARHSHNLLRFDSRSGYRIDDHVAPPATSLVVISSRQAFSSESFLAGARAEYRRPLGLRLQADLASEALFEVGGEGQLRVANQARIQRLVGEQWFAEGYAVHTRDIAEPGSSRTGWVVVTGGSISYFLEDFCRLSLAVDRQESSGDAILTFLPSEHRVDLSTQLRLSFGRGRLDAPGRMAPVRPGR